MFCPGILSVVSLDFRTKEVVQKKRQNQQGVP
jgi:hypothetical protein